MSARLAHAVLTTLAARTLSGVVSFLAFAQVVRLLPGPDAARVLFFSFSFGFVLATLRAFHLIGTAITGVESRSERLRRIRASARTLLVLAALLSPLIWFLLNAQGVGLWVTGVAVVLTLLCGFDLDLARAVARRQPALPLLTAAGGLVGAGLLLWVRTPTVALCALAFVLQWLPAALYHLRYGWRILRPLARGRRPVLPSLARAYQSGGALLMAVYDGAVINAPFLLALSLPALQAVDLAVGNRLFVASLALYALIGNWVVSGDIERMARRLTLSPAVTFAGSQFVAAAGIGSAYAVLYAGIAQSTVGFTSMVIFLATLTGFVAHSTAIRYTRARESRVRSSALYMLALACFYALMFWQKAAPPASLAVIVGAVLGALATPAVLQFVVGMRKR